MIKRLFIAHAIVDVLFGVPLIFFSPAMLSPFARRRECGWVGRSDGPPMRPASMSGAVQLRLLLVGAVLGTVVGGFLLFPIGRSAGGATPAAQATRRPSASPFVVPTPSPTPSP